jgi:hypothetical protein
MHIKFAFDSSLYLIEKELLKTERESEREREREGERDKEERHLGSL